MNRDLSGEDHRANPPGSTIGSHGGKSLVPRGSLTDRGSRVGPPEDEESGPGFIVKVKVKSEFVDDSFPQHEGEAHLVKTENFQRNFLQTSQDALSKEGVKQEPCDSPSMESSNAFQMLTVKAMLSGTLQTGTFHQPASEASRVISHPNDQSQDPTSWVEHVSENSGASQSIIASDTPSSSTGGKRKRIVLTINQKIDICRRLEKGENRNALMREYNVGSSTIYDIKAQKDKLLEFDAKSETDKVSDKRRTLHKPKMEQLDKVLYEWFALKRSEGAAISGPKLIEKARHFYDQMGLTDQCAFSDGWLACFKLRHGIQKLDISREQKFADHEAAKKFSDNLAKVVAKHDLTPDQIYNADETGLFWRCLPTSTLVGYGETSTAVFKKNKDLLTILMCANAAGTHRVKLLVVGKFKLPRSFKGVHHLPVDYQAQASSWMDRDIFYDWFHHVFVRAVKEHFRKIGLPEDSRCILLLDTCRAHPLEAELVSRNIFTIFLPPNVTSLIQPMDQGVIHNLKCLYRRKFLRKLLSHDDIIQDFQKQFSIKDAIYNVAQAWESMKSVTLRRAWRKVLPIVMFVEGSSDEEDFAGFNTRRKKSNIQEISSMVRLASDDNPLQSLTEAKIEEWCEVDRDVEVTRVMTDSEIIDRVVNPQKEVEQQENDSEEDDDSKEEDFSTEHITWAHAGKGLDTLVKFAERQKAYSAQEVMQLHLIQEHFMRKRQETTQQSDIRKWFNKASGVRQDDEPDEPEKVKVDTLDRPSTSKD